jgi:hypothetical protein
LQEDESDIRLGVVRYEGFAQCAEHLSTPE